MNLHNRKEAIHVLGSYLLKATSRISDNQTDASDNALLKAMQLSQQKNGWFTKESQLDALKNWANCMNKDNINEWLSSYSITENTPKTIGIIPAGNIPMVGWHDVLCVFLSGHHAQIKLSSKDAHLIPFLVEYLQEIAPEIGEKITFVDKLQNYDAVIATGSDNTSRYFESYFSKVPHIIRKNRTSVAVLSSEESQEDLAGLASDVFTHFGLGCRNVTQLFVPKDYDLDQIFKAFYAYKDVIHHHKYANNFDYHRTIYLMKNEPIIENGFLLLKEDDSLFSPIATLFYSSYENIPAVLDHLKTQEEKIQCVVGNVSGGIPFGKAQQPDLQDYADGVDTIAFLTELT